MVFTSFQTDFVTGVHLHAQVCVIHVTCTVDSPTHMSSSFRHNPSPNSPSFLLSSLPSPPWQPEKQTTGWHTQRSTLANERKDYRNTCTCVCKCRKIPMSRWQQCYTCTYSFSLSLCTCTYMYERATVCTTFCTPLLHGIMSSSKHIKARATVTCRKQDMECSMCTGELVTGGGTNWRSDN